MWNRPSPAPKATKNFWLGLKKNKPIKTVGLIANPQHATETGLVRKAADLITDSGRKLMVDQTTVNATGVDGITLPNAAELARLCDLMLVIGGDGTVLQVETNDEKSQFALGVQVVVGAFGLLGDGKRFPVG